jgi:hypothetical protein
MGQKFQWETEGRIEWKDDIEMGHREVWRESMDWINFIGHWWQDHVNTATGSWVPLSVES